MFKEQQLEEAVIDKLENLGYEYLYGPSISRNDYEEVIIKDIFYDSMFRINSNITTEIVDEIYRKLTKNSTADLVQINKEISHMLYAGVEIPLDKDRTYTAKLIDRDDIENNIFNVVNQYTIRGYKEKRVDIILFINGIPIVVFELKSAIREEVDIQNAYNQIKNYQLDVPKLFYYNAFNVITDGVNARIGTITSNFSRYMTWKSKDGEKPTKDVNQLETLLEGVLKKERLLDIITNFIVFQTKEDKNFRRQTSTDFVSSIVYDIITLRSHICVDFLEEKKMIKLSLTEANAST